MKLKEPLRYLKQVGTGHVYIWTENLASRTDMVECEPPKRKMPEPRPEWVNEPKPEWYDKPKAESKPESKSTPFKIEKAKKADAGE